jgi:hypothetical protein
MNNWKIPRHFSSKGGVGIDGSIMRNAMKRINLENVSDGTIYTHIMDIIDMPETIDAKRKRKYAGRIVRSASRILTRFFRRVAITQERRKEIHWNNYKPQNCAEYLMFYEGQDYCTY